MVTKRTLFSGGRLPNVRAASLPNAAERGWQPKSALFRGRQKEISQQQLASTVQVHQLYNFRERLSPWYDADYVFVSVSVWLCVFSRVGASCVGRPTCVCAACGHPSGALINIIFVPPGETLGGGGPAYWRNIRPGVPQAKNKVIGLVRAYGPRRLHSLLPTARVFSTAGRRSYSRW
jgi:hypothetical protein